MLGRGGEGGEGNRTACLSVGLQIIYESRSTRRVGVAGPAGADQRLALGCCDTLQARKAESVCPSTVSWIVAVSQGREACSRASGALRRAVDGLGFPAVFLSSTEV